MKRDITAQLEGCAWSGKEMYRKASYCDQLLTTFELANAPNWYKGASSRNVPLDMDAYTKAIVSAVNRFVKTMNADEGKSSRSTSHSLRSFLLIPNLIKGVHVAP